MNILKRDKQYLVPGKEIHWYLARNSLNLSCTLDWGRCEMYGIQLPPEGLGKCRDWRNIVSDEGLISVFTAVWDIRRVSSIGFKEINNRLLDYAVDRTQD